MASQGGRKIVPVPGYSVFLDATIKDSATRSAPAWINLVGNGNNCVWVNDPLLTREEGKKGYFSIGPQNQYGTMSDLGLGGDFTIIAWVHKLDATSQGYFIGAGWQTSIQAVNFGVVGLTPTLNSGWGWAQRQELAAGTIDITNWYHLCAVKSSGVAYMYVNGELKGSGTFNPGYYNRDAAATSYIGRSAYDSGNLPFAGTYYYFYSELGMILIYNSIALNSSQILDNYNQTKGKFGR